MKIIKYIGFGIIPFLFFACNDKPKVITANSTTENSEFKSGIFSNENNTIPEATSNTGSGFTENLHTVVVTKTLPTKKYVYMNVTEGGKQFWVATRKQDVNVGETYFYRDGLLKTNFESKEYNRVFDTIYLVSNIVSHNHATQSENGVQDFSDENQKITETASQKQTIPTHTEEIVQHKGSIKISELVADPKSYEGKTVQLTGKVVKINPSIMNRNWLHLQDGSKNEYDLVITTNTFVPEGKVITIRAQVTLNKDFGAGYRYDLILENGVIVE